MPDQDENPRCAETMGKPYEEPMMDDFELPAPGRERMYGRFDGIPPQAVTARNIANRRRVIE